MTYVAFAALLAVVLGVGCYVAYRLGVRDGLAKTDAIMTPEEAGAEADGAIDEA